MIHEESTGGFCARDATQFPQGINLASTWDPGAGRAGRHRHRASAARRRRPPDAGPRPRHRPRCPLGPPGGDLRRGSRAGQPHGRRLRPRGAVAGRRRHRQAFPRLRRAGRGLQLGLVLHGSPPPARRHRGAVPRRHQRSRRRRRHAVVQRDRRAAAARISRTADRAAPGGAGLSGASRLPTTSVSAAWRTSTTAPSDEADAARLALLAGLDVELPSYWCYRQSPCAGARRRRAVGGRRRVLPPRPGTEGGARPLRAALRRRVRRGGRVRHPRGPRPGTASGLGVDRAARQRRHPAPAGRRPRRRPRTERGRSALLLGDYHFPAHLELQHAEAALSPVGSEFAELPPQNPTPTPLEALRQRVEIVDEFGAGRRGRRLRRRPQRPHRRRTPPASSATSRTSGSRPSSSTSSPRRRRTACPWWSS